MYKPNTKYGAFRIGDLEIDHGVLYMGVGPYLSIEDVTEEDCVVHIDSLEKARLLKYLLEGYIKSLESGIWDCVHEDVYKDKGD